jgi:hypothetical protein
MTTSGRTLLLKKSTMRYRQCGDGDGDGDGDTAVEGSEMSRPHQPEQHTKRSGSGGWSGGGGSSTTRSHSKVGEPSAVLLQY